MEPSSPINPSTHDQPAPGHTSPSSFDTQQAMPPLPTAPVPVANFNSVPVAPAVHHGGMQNQFAPPAHNPAAALSSSDDGEYSSNPFKSTAKGLGRALSVNPVSSLSITGIFILFYIAAILVIVIGSAIPALRVIFPILGVLAIIVILLKAYAASIVLHIASKDNQTVTGRQAFGQLSTKRLLPFIGTSILSFLATIIGLVLLIVPGLIIGARWSLAPFIVYSEGLGPVAALKRSWKLTKGHTFEMLGSTLAQLWVIGLSGGLLSLVGMQASYANRYDELIAAEKENRSTGKMHWLNPVLVIVTAIVLGGYIGLIAWIASRDNSVTNDFTNTTTNSDSNNNPFNIDYSTDPSTFTQ